MWRLKFYEKNNQPISQNKNSKWLVVANNKLLLFNTGTKEISVIVAVFSISFFAFKKTENKTCSYNNGWLIQRM